MAAEVVDSNVEKYGNIAVIRAQQYGQTIEYSFHEMLFQQSTVVVQHDTGVLSTTKILPGIHMDSVDLDNPLAATSAMLGPSQKRIMIVGAWPNSKESDNSRLLHGDWVQEMSNLMRETSFPVADTYYTTFVKQYVHGKKAAIPKELIQEYKALFQKELELVNPDLVIVLGAKVLKALFGPRATMEMYKGRTISAEESPIGVKTTAILDFASLVHVPENRAPLTLELARIVNEMSSGVLTVADEIKTDYVYVSTLNTLEDNLNKIEEEYTGWLAVDCEWGGNNQLDGELRCLQFSWAPGKALVVVFNNSGMQPTELGNRKNDAWALIKKLVENGKTRLIGHFIRADLPWLVHNGVDVSNAAMFGWDTGLAGHLLDENWSQGLETYTARYTTMGRYEVELNEWIKANKYQIDGQGYGGIPDEILLPYAAKDADVTFRIFLHQFKEMHESSNARIFELFNTVVMPATMPILEMEMTGMNVDIERLELLSQLYTEKRQDLVQKLQNLLNWPEFNPDSPVQKAAAMFAWVKPGAKSRPPKEATLGRFQPIRATNGKKWEEVLKLKDGMESYSPSTERAVIQELLLTNKDDELLNAMLLYTAIAQTVKTFTGSFVPSENGSHSIEGGLLSKVWADNRVHARIRQTIETGRYGHSDPNMAQLPKTAEGLVGKAFVGDNVPVLPIRSCFQADPGWVLVDCDWVQAELFVMAWLSGDENMQKKLSDPTSDFHSEVAIDMFRLPAPPEGYSKGLKEWLKESGNSKYRTIAKTITFGIAYGRGAAAIRQAVYMEGINISIDEAQESIDKFKETFPSLAFWLESQQSKVETQGYVENGFGRRRRFQSTNDKELISHQKRQAMNAPIQGTVGDLMSLALVNLFMIRTMERPHLQYKVLMSVHDQIIVTCPAEQVDETIEVMTIAMCDRCKIPNNSLTLGIDPEVCIRWSEPLTADDVVRYPSLAKYCK
jgi:uracil-DNA glycosylase family 4